MTFETFEIELNRLVAAFTRQHVDLTSPGYAEAQLRDDFLNPFFRALGWDLENKVGHIQNEREVEIESRTDIAGKAKRADYLFRTDGTSRFICEAKKPRETLGPKYAFQAKRYAWNKNLPLAVLSDFEQIKIYVVGGKPHMDRPDEGLWKSWHFKEFPFVARQIWDLLARSSVAAGSIDALLDSLPKRAPTGRGKAKQLYLIKPDRTRALDTEFLGFLDESRRSLGSDLVKHNPDGDIREVSRLTEAVQHILDRLLFLRICEDRDIDTGTRLDSIVQTWRRSYARDDTKRYGQTSMFDGDVAAKNPGSRTSDESRDSLWYAIVRHFRALDRRPASHVPFFNGQLFKPHFTEDLYVGDQWLADFIGELSDDESVYLFNVIEVEILGNVYERFLGKIVRPHGRGVTIEEKPEVRKAGGVYYTPRYIVNYIVEQTVGKLLTPILDVKTFATFEKQTSALHLLDPACGSGSFLIRCFERVCEHWQRRLTRKPDERRKELCWVDPVTGDVHLTVELKRRILRDNVYGVDIDAQAVEVTQLSLYLKMLENENRTTLQRQRELFSKDTALLPSLENNIKCGNSLISSDFSVMSEDLVRVRAFDWPVQFKDIMKEGGFDAVVGNPPYGALLAEDESDYLRSNYHSAEYQIDTYPVFAERAHALLKMNSYFGVIIPSAWVAAKFNINFRQMLCQSLPPVNLAIAPKGVFADATVETVVMICIKSCATSSQSIDIDRWDTKSRTKYQLQFQRITEDPAFVFPIYRSPDVDKLVVKISSSNRTFSDFSEAVWGVKVYQKGKGKPPQKGYESTSRCFHSEEKSKETHKKLLGGSEVRRYDLAWAGGWVDYGVWLAEPRSPSWFEGERVLIREVTANGCIQAVIATEPFVFSNSVDGLRLKPDAKISLKFLLGLLNSKVVSFYNLNTSANAFKGAFPKVLIKDLLAFPLPPNDSDQMRSRMIALVDRMLALTPKFRAVETNKERAILQNAVTATDQKIDQLVYELYGLTPEEIALIEGETQA